MRKKSPARRSPARSAPTPTPKKGAPSTKRAKSAKPLAAKRTPATKRTGATKRALPTKRRFVYGFDDVAAAEKAAGSWDGVRGLLGGKGANLADMVRVGLPVPPGFTVTTEACNAFLAAGADFPPGLWEEITRALARLEQQSGKRFGDPTDPLLVSCRSGAKFSMPGMMDTVLNIGLSGPVTERLAILSGDERFAWDSWRRLVQMFGRVVLGLPDEPFEEALRAARRARAVASDSDLNVAELKGVVATFLRLVEASTGKPFPVDPAEQLRLAVAAVFQSWNGRRAHDYRVAAGIPHDLGTAVNVVAMVFGNLGQGSGTGVFTTRNVSTGEDELEGDFLESAQGEDVVSGTRATLPIAALAEKMPAVDLELRRVAKKLERHYRDVQDVEFTVERGTLWMLQTRDAKRTAKAAIRIAVELTKERRITREEAIRRVKPDHVDYFLHPQFDPKARRAAAENGSILGSGLAVSPGAAIGVIAFDADTAERWARKEGRKVVLVRPETNPNDVHGMLAAQGVVTSRGGRTSHAALVARQFGKPAVVGAMSLEVDVEKRELRAPGGRVLKEGDALSLDGSTGEIFAGEVATLVPDIADPHLIELLGWADKFRKLGVYANADYPRDATRARAFGAEGIGLCRTEHMFFETERLPVVQAMILAQGSEERADALAKLLPMQRQDFAGIFEAMNGLPVTIRLIDPPLHEFLPNHDDLLKIVTELETRLADGTGDAVAQRALLSEKKKLLTAVERLREQNPMLGLRGVRLGIHMPELVRMQVRAIFEAACDCVAKKIVVKPKIMIPLTAMSEELQVERALLEEEAATVLAERKAKVAYEFGTMIEVPRAALAAARIAKYAEFFSFGTNDLTQTTFGISRDDAEPSFLMEYLEKGILQQNPFATLDQRGVGLLMRMAVEGGRSVRPGLDVGICGEHGGDPASITFCHSLGLNYVSCSPFRVPVARLAAAHAALGEQADHR